MKAKHALWAAGAVGLLLLLRRGAGWGQRGSGDGWGPSPEDGGQDQGADEELPEGRREGDGAGERQRAPLLVVTPDPDAAAG